MILIISVYSPQQRNTALSLWNDGSISKSILLEIWTSLYINMVEIWFHFVTQCYWSKALTTNKQNIENSVLMRQDINFAQATINSECKTKQSMCSVFTLLG